MSRFGGGKVEEAAEEIMDTLENRELSRREKLQALTLVQESLMQEWAWAEGED